MLQAASFLKEIEWHGFWFFCSGLRVPVILQMVALLSLTGCLSPHPLIRPLGAAALLFPPSQLHLLPQSLSGVLQFLCSQAPLYQAHPSRTQSASKETPRCCMCQAKFKFQAIWK